jgi:hypothetical protein
MLVFQFPQKILYCLWIFQFYDFIYNSEHFFKISNLIPLSLITLLYSWNINEAIWVSFAIAATNKNMFSGLIRYFYNGNIKKCWKHSQPKRLRNLPWANKIAGLLARLRSLCELMTRDFDLLYRKDLRRTASGNNSLIRIVLFCIIIYKFFLSLYMCQASTEYNFHYSWQTAGKNTRGENLHNEMTEWILDFSSR